MSEFILRKPIEGNFNTNYFKASPGGESLIREPKINKDLWANLIDEYRQIGFTGLGGRVSRRSPWEQYLFSQKAAGEGLLVLPPLSFTNNHVEYPFLSDSVTVERYLRTNPQDASPIIMTLWHDLYQAHSKGYIYGDRWAGNILVDPHYGLIHIDFDLEISGNPAIELDVAQVIYHLLWAGGEVTLPFLATLLSQSRDWFRLPLVITFLKGLARFLRSTPVGGIEQQVEIIIELVHSQYDRQQNRYVIK